MDKQRERLVELLEKHCAVAECKAYGQDCTAEDCASCLADYILADGWMRPPCKVGDKIYRVIFIKDGTGSIVEEEVVGFHIGNFPNLRGHKRKQYFIVHHKVTNTIGHIDFEKLGKTVFLTKEEAEEALKGGVQG